LAAPSPALTKKVVEEWMQRARKGAGYAENAVQFLTTLGRVDDAFAVLRAYFFSEGFDCGELRFTATAGTYTPRDDRLTSWLFNPALARLRPDNRFGELVERLGLAAYWRETGRPPDYLTSRD
jgi:hypothetical protein